MNNTINRISQVIVEHLDVAEDRLQDTTSFSKELSLDSLDAMDLLMAIDEEFGVRIDAKEMEKVDNLNELVAIITRHIDKSH